MQKLIPLSLLVGTLLLSGCGPSSEPTTTDDTSISEMSKLANNAPIASDTSVSVARDTDVSYTLTALDTDSDVITFELISDPANGIITQFDPSNGTFIYMPNAGFSGKDTFTYRVSDGVSSCPDKTVTIEVAETTTPIPLAPSDLAVTPSCKCSVKLSWADNSDNEDGFEIYKNGELICVKEADETSAMISGLSASTSYTFEVRAKNSSGKSEAVTATFTTEAELEIPLPPTALTVKSKSDTGVRLTWTDNADNEVSYEIYQNGTFLKSISPNCACTMIYNLTPETKYTFEVKAKNDAGLSSAATVTVTTDAESEVTEEALIVENNAPSVITSKNEVITMGDKLSVSADANDTDGTIVKYVWSENGEVLSQEQTFAYEPTTIGDHFLIITVTDDDNATASATTKVVVQEEVTAVIPNETPTANAGEDQYVAVNKSVTLNGSGIDSDGNIVNYQWLENGVVLGTEAKLDYTPKTVGTHTLTFIVTDNDGATATDTVDVEVSTAAIDTTKPVIMLTGDATVSLTVGDSYTDAGATASDDKDGDITSKIISSGSVDTSKAGTYMIEYNVADAAGNIAIEVSRTVIVSEAEEVANTKPTAEAQSVTHDEDTSMGVTLSGVDTDGDLLTYKITQEPTHGSVVLSGNVATYTPYANYFGDDSFTFIVNDGKIDSEPATVNLTVNGVNDAPVAKNVYFRAHLGQTSSGGNVGFNDYDPDGDKLTFTQLSSPKYGGIVLESDGSVTFTPPYDYSPNYDVIKYQVSDGKGGIATAYAYFSIWADTVKPEIILNGDSTVTLQIGQSYSDAGATATDDVDGDITSKIKTTGTVETNKAGTYTISYDVTDVAGNAATTVTRTVIVEGVSDTVDPVISLIGDDVVVIAKGETYTDPGVTASDNIDGDITNKIIQTNNINTSTAGEYWVKYSVSDSSGNVVTMTRTVTVIDLDDILSNI